MLVERSIATLAVGLTSFGAGLVTIAQGVLDPTAITLERIIGGGILMSVAVVIVFWSRQMGREMRATLTAALEKTQETLDQQMTILEAERTHWSVERAAIRDERDTLRQELMETHALLREERALRISLERAGIADRRNGEDPRPADT